MAEEMYSFMAPMASAKMISDTLSRLCELGILFSSSLLFLSLLFSIHLFLCFNMINIESVAERIVEQGGIELLMDFMLTGIDHYYLADLWNSILQHSMLRTKEKR